MNLVIGILIYKADLEMLRKNVSMLLRQSINYLRPDFKYSLIIQDNDSGAQIDEAEKMLSQIPEIEKLPLEILSSRNVGFGAGHNHIFSAASDAFENFDYYLCLNPDGIPHFRMIEKLVSFASGHNDNGIFEARQFPVEHPKVYNFASGRTDWCSGCSLLIPKTIYQEVEGFDDLFFLYMEDVDFSWRARLRGFGTYTVHDALFFHALGEFNLGADNTERNMLISGLKLGWKYQDMPFKTMMRDLLTKHLSEYEIEQLEDNIQEHFKQNPYPLARTKIRPPFINFSAGMSFANTRW